MNRNRFHDATLLALAGIALIAEVGLLLYQMRIWTPSSHWARSIDGSAEVGQVIARNRSLKVRAASSLTWYPIGEGERIQALDTLMTGAESSARILLHGQGELFLEPYTLIHFSERHRKEQLVLAFELNEGTVRLRTKERIRLSVRDREVSLSPDTEMVVAAGSIAAPPEVLVTKGQVEVENRSGEMVKMVAGEAFSLSSERGLARADTRLNIIAKTPREGDRVPLTSTGEIVFGWEGDQAEVLEWDTDPSFSSASTVPVQAGKVSLALAPGRYYWRVRRAVAVSAPSLLTVLPGAKYAPLSPRVAEVVKMGKRISLNWEPVPEAQDYQLEFSTDPSLQKRVRRERLTNPKKNLGTLKPGKYFWRVRARHPEYGDWPLSEIYSFSIKNTLAPPKPKGVRILPQSAPVEPAKGDSSGYRPPIDSETKFSWLAWVWDELVPHAHARSLVPLKGPTLWMEFEWEVASGASRYRLQIASKRDFKEMLAELDTDYTTSLVELPDRREYFWRVASIDEHGLVGAFSQIQRTRREKAKPRPAPRRDVAQVPSAPTPIAGLPTPPEEVRDPEPPPPPYLPMHIRRLGLGYGAGYWRHSAKATNFQANTNGIPPHRMQLGMHAGVGHLDAEFSASYARLNAVSQDAIIRSFQNDFKFDAWSAELSLWHWKVRPFGLGLRARSEVDYRRVGSEALQLRSIPVLGLGVAWRKAWSWTRVDDIQLEVWAEVVPVGLRRGGGLYSRFRIDLWQPVRNVAVAAELTAYPHFRKSGEIVTEWNAETSAAVLLRWNVDDGTTIAQSLPTGTNGSAPQATSHPGQHEQKDRRQETPQRSPARRTP